MTKFLSSLALLGLALFLPSCEKSDAAGDAGDDKSAEEITEEAAGMTKDAIQTKIDELKAQLADVEAKVKEYSVENAIGGLKDGALKNDAGGLTELTDQVKAIKAKIASYTSALAEKE